MKYIFEVTVRDDYDEDYSVIRHGCKEDRPLTALDRGVVLAAALRDLLDSHETLARTLCDLLEPVVNVDMTEGVVLAAADDVAAARYAATCSLYNAAHSFIEICDSAAAGESDT